MRFTEPFALLVLTAHAVKIGEQKLDYQKIFSLFDEDGDNKISRQDYICRLIDWAKKANTTISERQWDQIFKNFDKAD